MQRYIRRLVVVVLLFGIVAGVLASCASPSSPAVESATDAKTEIRIGIITDYSGEGADTVWQYTTNAANLFLDQVNANGGVQVGEQRIPVNIFYADDKASPEGGSAAALQLINQDQVVALVGGSSSDAAIPAGAVAENAGIPLVAHVSTNPKTTEGRKFVFRAIFLDPFQGKSLAKFARNTLKIERAAALYDVANVYCQSMAEAFEQEFETLGGEMVAMETFTNDNPVWDEQLDRIAKLKPDVLFLPNYNRFSSPLSLDARTQGITATFLAGDTWSYATPEERVGYEGGYFTAGYALDSPSDENKVFVEAYRVAYDEDPTSEAALTYDALGMVAAAIESQGAATPTAIRDGLAGLTAYAGVTGTMRFEDTGDPLKSVVIMQVKDGEFVWFEEVKP